MITAQRFDAKVTKTNDCWLWTGAVQSRGYGSFVADGTPVLAHRYAYERAHGRIPDGLTINHLCCNKLCVNPQHLEAVTLQDNLRHARQVGLTPPPALSLVNAAKTHCPQGHPYDYVNPQGHRACRECKRASYHRRRAQRVSA